VIALVSTEEPYEKWFRAMAERWRPVSPMPIEVWCVEPIAELPAGPEATDEIVEDIIQYQRWLIETGIRFTPDLTIDQWVEFARNNFSYYASAFEIAVERRGLSHVLLAGASRAAQRVAHVAAGWAGLKVSYVEPAIFPRSEGVGMTLQRRKAIYTIPSEEYVAWREHDADYDRIEAYREWWLSNRRTKYETYVEDRALEFDEPPVVWMQQVRGDAALYKWWVPNGALERITADVNALGAYVKGHPRDTTRWWTEFPEERVICEKTTIHDVFAKCRVVAVLSSGVGIEAWMYRLPVAVYGRPYYAQADLVNSSIVDALECPRINDRERLRFLDYLVYEDSVLIRDVEMALERIIW